MRAPSRDLAAERVLTGLWLVTGVLLVVRLWLDSHLELMFDEAYYALWAKHLAWSYFDHPPMVALWIRLSTLLFGEHELGVRALGTLSAAAGTGIIYLISWHLFGNRQAAIFAALLYCAMLLISAGAIDRNAREDCLPELLLAHAELTSMPPAIGAKVRARDAFGELWGLRLLCHSALRIL